jgi:hypothetical protein
MLKEVRSIVAVSALVVAAAMIPVSAANADVTLAQCVGTGTTFFNPALTNSPQTVSVSHESGFTCVLGADSGTIEWFDEVTMDCVLILEQLDIPDQTIVWEGGDGAATSFLDISSYSAEGSLATAAGTVTAGRFDGASFVIATEFLSASGSGIPLLCPAGLGTVSSATTAETLTIVSA